MTGILYVGAATAQAATTATTAVAAATTAVLRFAANVALQYAIATLAQSLLARTPKRDGAADTLIGLPVANTDSGPPRVWAMGRRVRVPIQVMWQEKKVRETTPRVKGKSAGSVRHVSFDVAFMLNDRYTQQLTQLVVNDSLLTWKSLNLIEFRTSAMTVTESSGQVTLTMDSTQDPDPNLVFDVGNLLEIGGLAVLSGPDPNGRYWEVVDVTGHTSSPGSIVLEPRSGQTTTGLNVTAGNPFAPAVLTRVDDAVVSDSFLFAGVSFVLDIRASSGNPPNHPFNEVFRPGDLIRVRDSGTAELEAGSTQGPGWWRVVGAGADFVRIDITGTSFSSVSLLSGTAAVPMKIEFWSQPTRAEGYLPPAFVLEEHYYPGSETQGEDPIIVGHEGSGNVGGFRGTAYQVLDDFDATNFGGTMPPLTEAVIDPDASLTWAQGLALVCERHNLPQSNVDTAGVDDVPLHGFYLRGPTTGDQALQQLLLVKQIATQDRNGVLSFFQIDNADVVQIQNGALFTDFGARVGEKPSVEEPSWGEVTEEELPTSVGIRFQDPDSGYGENYEHWGIRHPSAQSQENRQELDMRNVVMTRRDARNLAATIARRARINGRRVPFTLPKTYLHVLENDLMTWTDDLGNTHLVRVVRRDVGTNWLVRIEAVVERANISVKGSPVQSAAGSGLATIVPAAELQAIAIDSPPVLDDWSLTPGIHVAACAKPGSTWAGCTIYLSQDEGQNWVFVETLQVEHAIGALSATLAAAAPSENFGDALLTWDTASSATVEFDSVGTVPLVSSTEAIVAQGWQWFAVVDELGQVLEVFGARDVVQNSATNYTFTHLLRGLRGTWQGCAADHPTGLRVVGLQVLFAVAGKLVDVPGIAPSASLQFKFVPPGKDLATTPTVSITTRRRNVEPFPLRDVRKTYDSGDSSVTFAVTHWSRKNLPPGSIGAYPLDEPYEAYRFTLYDVTGTRQVYRKTKSAQNTGSPTLREPSVSFTSAEQIAAGYTPGPSETYWIDVEQIGQYANSPSILQEL
ncbi:MAG: hypothetical protein KDE27_08510 [Planctomycetes bacterium]|nr:hypothetical protein [Planctomycetota bacterium]